jgi:hypothetical protein
VLITEGDKIAIRRHLNIAFAGTPGYGDTLGLRVVTRAGQLEMYMNALQAQEESVLLGVPLALAHTYGPLTVGQVLTFTINGTAVTYTVTNADLLTPKPLDTVAANISLQVNTSGMGVLCAALSNGVFIETAFMMANRSKFASFTVSGGPQLIDPGATFPYPQLSIDTGDPANPIIYSGVLPLCNYLESSMLGSDARLAFWQAGSAATGQVVFNKAEMRMRLALYRQQTRQMAVLLGFSLGSHQPQGQQAFGLSGT